MSTNPRVILTSYDCRDDASAQPPMDATPVQLPIVNAVWSECKPKVEPIDDAEYAPMSNYEYENNMSKSQDAVVIKQEVLDSDYDPYTYEEPEEVAVEEDEEDNRPIQSVAPVRRIEQRVGFDRGLEPDYIVGATQKNGNLMFLMAWKNSEEADLLDSSLVYKRCPQIAIKFFEKRLTYS